MFCRHCGKVAPSDTSVNFCPNCGKSLEGDFQSDIQQQTIVKVAKFDSSPETLFQSCVSSMADLGIKINKMDRLTKYIETAAVVPKSPNDNFSSFPNFHLRVMEGDSSAAKSIIEASIFSEDTGFAITSFDKLIDALSSRLNQKPIAIVEGNVNDTST
jgi:hypothetical protein